MLKNIDCRFILEPPRRGGSNEYPQSMFVQNYENIRFLIANFQFLEVKFSIYLNRLVFVMKSNAGLILEHCRTAYEQTVLTQIKRHKNRRHTRIYNVCQSSSTI